MDGDSEQRFAGRIIDHAQSCSSATAFRLQVLDDLRKLAGCDGALFRPGAHWAGSRTVYLDEGPRFTDLYVEHADQYRPELAHWCTLSKGTEAFVYNEIYSSMQLRRMAVHSEIVRPEGIRSLMGCPVSLQGQLIGLIFLFRRGGGSVFSPGEASKVTRVLPVIGIADLAVKATTAPPAVAAPDERVTFFCAAFAALSRRERQIASLIGQGLQSKEIAALLGTSPATVRNQTLQIYRKLGLHGRALLTAAMQRAGLAANDAAPAAASSA